MSYSRADRGKFPPPLKSPDSYVTTMYACTPDILTKWHTKLLILPSNTDIKFSQAGYKFLDILL